jgi:hypothetical protein
MKIAGFSELLTQTATTALDPHRRIAMGIAFSVKKEVIDEHMSIQIHGAELIPVGQVELQAPTPMIERNNPSPIQDSNESSN